MSDSEYKRKRQLECLRLASDLRQLVGSIPNSDLRLHLFRMATIWTDQAEEGWNLPTQSYLHH